jgi:1,2-diacylglycerol 3-alpha-glucosyltransferase
MNMHIIQVTPRFPPAIGGVEEHVYQISLELLKRGHNVTVITSNEVDGKIYPLQMEVMQGIHVYRLPLFMPKLLRELWFIPDIRRVFRRPRGDVVHAHGYRCLSSCIAVYLAHSKHIPTVLTPHGIYPPRSFINALLKSIFDRTLGRLLLSFSDRIIALSEHNVRLILQIGASTKNIVIVPNGVNIDEYVKLQRNKKNLDELGSDGPVLLYIGRIDWNKRLEKVVESMPLILKEFPSAKFVIVGPDYAKYTNQLLDLARKLKVEHSLVITGKVPRKKLLEFYSMANVFLLPSSYEGFGLSMLEAISGKIPVIASPSGGPGDILTHGVDALLLEELTPEEIFKSVYAVLTDQELRETLVKNAFEVVKKKYTWKSVVDELELIYKQLITEKQ